MTVEELEKLKQALTPEERQILLARYTEQIAALDWDHIAAAVARQGRWRIGWRSDLLPSGASFGTDHPSMALEDRAKDALWGAAFVREVCSQYGLAVEEVPEGQRGELALWAKELPDDE